MLIIQELLYICGSLNEWLRSLFYLVYICLIQCLLYYILNILHLVGEHIRYKGCFVFVGAMFEQH